MADTTADIRVTSYNDGGDHGINLKGQVGVNMGSETNPIKLAPVTANFGGTDTPIKIAPIKLEVGHLQLRPNILIEFRLFGVRISSLQITGNVDLSQ